MCGRNLLKPTQFRHKLLQIRTSLASRDYELRWPLGVRGVPSNPRGVALVGSGDQRSYDLRHPARSENQAPMLLVTALSSRWRRCKHRPHMQLARRMCIGLVHDIKQPFGLPSSGEMTVYLIADVKVTIKPASCA